MSSQHLLSKHHLHPLPGRASQNGQTMISILVGVMISLITIVAILVVYKNAIEISGSASRSSMRDEQMAAALMAAQIDAQQAGFGLLPDANPHSIINLTNKQVVWRYKQHLTDTVSFCSGLLLIDPQQDPNAAGFYSLPAKLCTSADAVTWSVDERRALVPSGGTTTPGSIFYKATHRDGSDEPAEVGALTLQPPPTANTDTGFIFNLSPATCIPYMQQLSGLSAVEQLTLAASDGTTLLTVCLPNVKSS